MLSESSQHVLRALTWIAALPRQAAVSAGEIAIGAHVPRRYLSKILARLTRNRVLQARRGVKGGYRLARPAARIRLIEVVAPFEPTLGHDTCAFGGGRICGESDHCSMHYDWGRIREKLWRFLDRTTLADIAVPAEKKSAKARRSLTAARRPPVP